MSIKPILFNTEMVRGLLDGTKTVTRRVVKPQPAAWQRVERLEGGKKPAFSSACEVKEYNLPYRPGDILYVRETWRCQPLKWSREGGYSDFVLQYRADFTDEENDCYGRRGGVMPMVWRPSIHMPREAARIFLRVTDVRVEKLMDITEEDLVRDFCFCREAIETVGRDALAGPFWDSTIKPADRELYGWNANPWVWVIEFERCEKTEGD